MNQELLIEIIFMIEKWKVIDEQLKSLKLGARAIKEYENRYINERTIKIINIYHTVYALRKQICKNKPYLLVNFTKFHKATSFLVNLVR